MKHTIFITPPHLGHFSGSTLRQGSVHRLVNALDEGGPGHPTLLAKCGFRLKLLPILIGNGGWRIGWCNRVGLTQPTVLVRVPSIEPELVFSFVRNVLRDLGQKIERIEHTSARLSAGLEIPPRAGGEIDVAGDRERQAFGLPGLVQNLAVVGEAHHSAQTEQSHDIIHYLPEY